MTDDKQLTDKQEAFLNSIKDVIAYAVQTIDINKVRDMALEDLEPHFDMILDESWEDYSVDVPDIGKLKTAMRDGLTEFKKYHTTMVALDDKWDVTKAYLDEALENKIIRSAVAQKILPQKEATPDIDLAKAFNTVSENLITFAKDAFENKNLDRMNDDEIKALAQKQAAVLSQTLNRDEKETLIFESVIGFQAQIVLTQLQTELKEASANESNLASIYDETQKITLKALFDVAEDTGILPKDIRKRDDLGFKAPKRQP